MRNRSRALAGVPSRATAFILLCCALISGSHGEALAQQKTAQRQPKTATPPPVRPVPDGVMLRIIRAEDERRWDNDLSVLLFDKDGRVRERAALAAGRIGDERAVASLVTLLQTDQEESVRAMAAFALGETESVAGAASLADAAQKARETSEVRARAVEALGKIIAALPQADEARGKTLGEVILKALDEELRRGPRPNRDLVLLGLTAALRARPNNAGATVAKFLSSTDARVRADAANT
ncbi:MAG TPA: HEAT repeat domain-containing protein, partial [Pyrinomonadaceae bacterium]|nr:HEAT repeat domain-containing protein [Pyrinomonadaceae bacterium]